MGNATAASQGSTGEGLFGRGPGRWHAPEGVHWTNPENEALQKLYPNGGIFPQLPGGGYAPSNGTLLNGQPMSSAPSGPVGPRPQPQGPRYPGLDAQYQPGYRPPTPQEQAGSGGRHGGFGTPLIDPSVPAGQNFGQPGWWPTRVQDSFNPLGGGAGGSAALAGLRNGRQK